MVSENDSGKHGNALRAQIAASPLAVDATAWNALLRAQATPTPFMRHEYLAALHASGSAVPQTGWAPRFLLLWDGNELAAACPLYLKSHSYGEYVFDWAWANAYAEHGLRYYPKALVAVPFTPVPGSRLLARDAAARQALVRALVDWCGQQRLSSLHVLYGDDADKAACDAAGLMQRQQVQFHWNNHAPTRPASQGALAWQAAEPSEPALLRAVRVRAGEPGAAALSPEEAFAALGRPGGSGAQATEQRPFSDFDHFLASLSQDKRKKIRQERRKVAEAGVRFRWARGADITPADWAFFYRCYERTYLEHGNAPYLTPAFFSAVARELAGHWLLFVAERQGRPIACSLIALSDDASSAGSPNAPSTVAYGRYWGALERVDCLHFEACYYQPLAWCIAHGAARFEGGAQGEHKMARALMPVPTASSHWLAHPAFADAVKRFVQRESGGIEDYLTHLDQRSPFRR